jgi:hypothetical protein
MHYLKINEGGRPFSIGQLNPEKGFVHVLDDTSLDILLRTVNTINDFVNYLEKKEQFVLSGLLIDAAGEEDLLAYYLQDVNENDEHDFIFEGEVTGVVIDEGFWEDFSSNPQRLAQLEANKISYAWDALIESFTKHILGATQYYSSHDDVASLEKIIRFLARESRTRRRMLAKSLLDIIRDTPNDMRFTRVIGPSYPGDPFYVFLLLPHSEYVSYRKYREVRQKFLEACCMVVKVNFPEALDVVGIATESGFGDGRSEDAIYLDCRKWTKEDQQEAKSLKKYL